MRSIAAALLIAIAAIGFCQEEPEITANSAIVMDAQTGQVIWAKRADEQRFPASTTKIITAMVLLEKARPEEVVTVTKEAAATKGSGIRMKTGQKFLMRDLISAILVKSANNACMAAAIHVAGTEAKFVEMMNAKALSLGAVWTKFKNPHGLHDPDHFTTAHDLALIAQAAMKDPEIVRIVGQSKLTVGPIGSAGQEYRSTNHLLGVDPTNFGLKTGWTNPAGRCFVGWHIKDNMTLVTVLLGAEKWEPDQKAMMEWVWNTFEKRTLVEKSAYVATLKVPGALNQEVMFYAQEELSAVVRKGLPPPVVTLLPDTKAPLAAGQVSAEADFGGGFKVKLAPMNYVPSQLQAGLGAGAGVVALAASAGVVHRLRKKFR